MALSVSAGPRRFLVQLGVGFAFAHAEIVAAAKRPFLDDDDREPGLREDLGRHAPAGPAAHDQDVRLEGRLAIEGRRVDHLPARGDSFADRVGDHAGFSPSVGAPG